MTDETKPPEQIFTIAQAAHPGYYAPGGSGVHRYEPGDGNIWEIHYGPDGFRVYRRWFKVEPLEGEYTEWTDEERESEEEIKNGPVE